MARNCSERNGSCWKSDSSQRSSASARTLSASARLRRSSSSPASAPRNESRRVASPGGCVAAIGRTGRIPNGRPSSVSNNTGPAESGAAVASRIALTASATGCQGGPCFDVASFDFGWRGDYERKWKCDPFWYLWRRDRCRER